MVVRHLGAQMASLGLALPLLLLCLALLTAYITDFRSVIGLLLCVAAVCSSLERTISGYKERDWFYVVLGVVLLFVSFVSSAFYHGIMTWDYGPFYFPVSE